MFRVDLGTSCSGEVSECVAWVSDSGPVAPHSCFLPLCLSPRDNERGRETQTDRRGEMGREKRKIPIFYLLWDSWGGSVVKSLPGNAGDPGDAGLISRWRRSPGRGHGNPLQYSCLENPMDRGAWQVVIVHRVVKSRTMEVTSHRLTSHGSDQHLI